MASSSRRSRSRSPPNYTSEDYSDTGTRRRTSRSRSRDSSSGSESYSSGPDYGEFTPPPSPDIKYHTDAEPELAIKYDYDLDNNCWIEKKMTVTIEKEPMASGAMRRAYYVRDNETGEVFVGKRYKPKKKKGSDYSDVERDEQDYFQDCAMQAYASLWAKLYNAKKPPKKVSFIPTFALRLYNRRTDNLYACEKYLTGMYRKHNGNNGFVSADERNTPQAFSHWTYEASQRKLMIVDIQGVDDFYTDPQIHTVDGKGFGVGNMGQSGMDKFFRSHQCNAICRNLNLPRFGNRGDDLGTQPQWAESLAATNLTLNPPDLSRPPTLDGDDRDVDYALAGPAEPAASEQTITVYVRNARNKRGKYHKTMGHFKSFEPITLAQAQADGRRACEVCEDDGGMSSLPKQESGGVYVDDDGAQEAWNLQSTSDLL